MDADVLVREKERPDPRQEPLGAALHKARKERRMSLTRLSAAASVSAASLSRIENGLMSPTFDVVVRICDALGLSITGLIGGNEPAPSNLLTGGARRLRTPQYDYEVLGHSNGAAPFITLRTQILCPSLAAFGDMHSHRGFEQIIVHSGRIALHLGTQPPQLLAAGDTISFNSTKPHAVVAPHGPASVLWIYAPDHSR